MSTLQEQGITATGPDSSNYRTELNRPLKD